MSGKHHKWAILLPLALAACALGETQSTPPPPITLAAPPELVFSGQCSDTKALEDWLQVANGLTSDFITQMNTAAAQNRSEMRDELLTMASLRDAAHEMATPDCAVAAELKLTDAMNKGILTFQAYANGELSELGTTVGDVSHQIEDAMAMQNQLVSQLEAQFRQGMATPTPAS